jgi:hypothetical protein
MMATIIYNAADEAVARQIEADVRADDRADIAQSVVVVVSPEAVGDRSVLAAIDEALDQNRHIVPVIARAAALPRPVEHLEPVDFTEAYDYEGLRARLSAAPGEFHMKVRTARVAAANRRAGLVVGVLALVMFIAGLYLVGVLGVQAPAREYAYVETEIVLTRNYFIDQALPRSTEDAVNFLATVEAARPTLRPLLVATATAAARQGGD